MPRKKGKVKTKKVWGTPSDLPTSNLPTFADIHRYIAKLVSEKVAKKEVIKKVKDDLSSIWSSFIPNVPTLIDTRLNIKINRAYARHVLASRNHMSSKLFSEFDKTMNKLYDISLCKCQLIDEGCHVMRCILQTCPPLTHILCSCLPNKKVIIPTPFKKKKIIIFI
jgi:hypothetical protein